MTALLWLLAAAGLLALVWVRAAQLRAGPPAAPPAHPHRRGRAPGWSRRSTAGPPPRWPSRRDAGTTAAPDAEALRAAVARTRTAGSLDGDRESAENVLGRALAAADRAALPPAVLEELVDAEQL